MTHSDAVIHRDGVEFDAVAAVGVDHLFDLLTDRVQMHVTGYELGKGIGDGDDRFLKIFLLHTGGAPQSASPCHASTLGGNAAAKTAILHGCSSATQMPCWTGSKRLSDRKVIPFALEAIIGAEVEAQWESDGVAQANAVSVCHARPLSLAGVTPHIPPNGNTDRKQLPSYLQN